MRLIDADAFKDFWNKEYRHLYPTDKLMVALSNFPTINPETLRPTGRWENYPSHVNRRCSVCKIEYEKPKFNVRAKYCPNCGAKMMEG